MSEHHPKDFDAAVIAIVRRSRRRLEPPRLSLSLVTMFTAMMATWFVLFWPEDLPDRCRLESACLLQVGQICAATAYVAGKELERWGGGR